MFDETFQSIATSAFTALKKGSISSQLFTSIFGTTTDMQTYIKMIEAVENEIENLNEDKKGFQKNIDDTTNKLNKEKDALKKLQDELSVVNNRISELSKPRFAGQLDVEILIQNVDREIKKRKLADAGIADSYTFLQNALNSAKGGYDQLFFSIEKVTGAAKKSQDSYDAWKETVQEFIRDTVKSGNILKMNVSGAVEKFSTLLLSTSRFNDETDKTSDYISYLKDAYDVYYGGMTDDVNNAIQAHEEQASGVFSSSSLVISALQEQWQKQTDLTEAIKLQQDAVDESEKKLSDYKLQLDDVTKSIDIQNEYVKDLVKSFRDLADAMSQIKPVEIGNSAGYVVQNTPEYEEFLLGLQNRGSNQSSNVVNIGSINVNTNADNSREIANSIVKGIKYDLKTR
jgi:chromosome segregation ATPase